MKHLTSHPCAGVCAGDSRLGRASGRCPGSSQVSSEPAAPSDPSIPRDDQENARQARALLDQAIQALGGQAYLNIHDMQQQGRTYSFYHGRPTSNGVVVLAIRRVSRQGADRSHPERDVAYIYTGDKGYEITYKGPHALEKKDLDDYLRRRRFSLENVLRTWINDPGVALFYDGNALAGNLPAQQVTLINSKERSGKSLFRSRHASAHQEELQMARSGRQRAQHRGRDLRQLQAGTGRDDALTASRATTTGTCKPSAS